MLELRPSANNPRLPRRRRWRLPEQLLPWLSALLLMAIVLVSLSLFAWFLFFTEVFFIKTVAVINARDHISSEITEIVNRQIERSIIPRHIFVAQVDLIENDILNALPAVRGVHITRTLPSTIRVIVQEKEPALLLLSNKEYFFVDHDGVPYERARLETLPGVVLPTVKNNDDSSTVAVGVPALTDSFVTFIQEIQESAPDIIGAPIGEIRIPSLAAREVHFVMSNNWLIKFDVNREASEQLEILRRILDESISEEEKQRLSYIDLRIPRRVYYKVD